MNRLLEIIMRRGFRRGLAGEPAWIAVAVLAWLVMRSTKVDPVVWAGNLAEGEGLVIRASGPRPPGLLPSE